MNYALGWFLVSMAGQVQLGPLPEQACQEAAALLRDQAIVCLQATQWKICDVPGRPGTFTSCPVFDTQHVTVKP